MPTEHAVPESILKTVDGEENPERLKIHQFARTDRCHVCTYSPTFFVALNPSSAFFLPRKFPIVHMIIKQNLQIFLF